MQNKLNLRNNILAFDINQDCSGFVYGLFTTHNFKTKRINKALLICSDTYTKYIKKGDRSCETIFSDGASATIIRKIQKKEFLRILTDSSGLKFNYLKIVPNIKINQKPKIFMDGKQVLFTMSNIPNIVLDLLKKKK